MTSKIYKQTDKYIATNGTIQAESVGIMNRKPVFKLDNNLVTIYPWLRVLIRDHIYNNHLPFPVSKFVDDDCWLSTSGKGSSGYRLIHLVIPSHGFYIKRLNHIASYLVFHGNIPPGKLITHKCDVKPCCNPDHLELGTHKTNGNDRSKRHSHAGPLNRAWKVNTREVCLIRYLSSNNIIDNNTLGDVFRLHKRHIESIVAGDSYRDVDCSWFDRNLREQVKFYNESETKLLLDPNYTIPEVASILKRTRSSIAIKRNKIGLKVLNRFTPEEDDIVVSDKINSVPTVETAKKLNRDVQAIYSRRKLLRMKGFIK